MHRAFSLVAVLPVCLGLAGGCGGSSSSSDLDHETVDSGAHAVSSSAGAGAGAGAGGEGAVSTGLAGGALTVDAGARSVGGAAGEGDASSPGPDGGKEGGASALPSLASFVGGTNLSGLEFNSGKLPGKANTDYGVPTHAEVDYFVGKKLGFLRIPFLWERMQPTLDGDLDAGLLGIYTDLVTYATSKGAYVLVDPHNYARYDGQVIGSGGSAATAAQFADFWGKLADVFKGNPRAVFGLMNEPNGMKTELWLSDANAAIAAIRKTGATNLITVPGNGYTGAHSWTSDGYGTADSTVMLGVVDPLDNYIFEVHQYLDSDSSGTHDTCDAAPEGSQALTAFTEWARTNGKRAMLGEFGAANNATCLANLDDMLTYIDKNRDVWEGWTWWSAGPWWGSYMFSIEPSNGVDAPQTATLLKHL